MTDSIPQPLGAAMAEPAGSMLGQFELRALVGETPWSRVWQALDTRLGQELRLKLIKTTRVLDAAFGAQWSRETHGSGHLVHAAILPVREAGLLDGQPYLASEWVPGQSLGERIEGAQAVDPVAAVTWMVELLDALVLAHAAGVVHGRLKPANILVDAQGRIHLMDFAHGGALTADYERSAGPLPGKLAPQIAGQRYPDEAEAQHQALREWLPPGTAKGFAPTARTDLYAVGMLLLRLLGGGAHSEADPASSCRMLESLGMDAELLAIVQQESLTVDPAQRPPSAHAFGARLQQWLADADAVTARRAALIVTPQQSALDILLQRMQQTSDFPAMAHAVSRIQAMADSETESVAAVADAILKDVALSNKLLRIVNSAYYGRGGSIATVSRAVSLIGFNGVRNMALGLVLLEGMRDKAHAALLMDEFLRALLAGAIARELADGSGDGESAFIGALFQDLGCLLAKFYFVPEALQVQALVRAGQGRVTQESAAVRVLGLGYEALGLGVARLWDLPLEIQRCMRKPVGEPPARPVSDATERMRWIALAANALADALLQTEAPEQQAALKEMPGRSQVSLHPLGGPGEAWAGGAVEQVQQRHARAIGLAPRQMQDALERARQKLIDLAVAMDLPIVSGSPVQRLLRPVAAAVPGSGAGPAPAVVTDRLAALNAALVQGLSPGATLAAGSADVQVALVQGLAWTDIVQMVLETMQRAIGLSHLVFCLRDPKLDALTGRLGRGEGVDPLVRAFHVPLGPGASDLFHAVCARGADTLIGSTSAPRLAERLPPWYRKLAGSPALLLLPLTQSGKCYGLIYADLAGHGALVLQEQELDLLRALREQVHSALRPPA